MFCIIVNLSVGLKPNMDSAKIHAIYEYEYRCTKLHKNQEPKHGFSEFVTQNSAFSIACRCGQVSSAYSYGK